MVKSQVLTILEISNLLRYYGSVDLALLYIRKRETLYLAISLATLFSNYSENDFGSKFAIFDSFRTFDSTQLLWLGWFSVVMMSEIVKRNSVCLLAIN